VKVKGATFEHGLLEIDLVREVRSDEAAAH
jgi:HSP20 family molecular chaperone IbpA